MRIPLASLSLILAIHSAAAPAQDARDLGFEAGALGETPAPWFVPTAGWKAELTEEKASAAKRSLKLSLPEKSDAPFGNVMQHLPAADLAGRHVTLTARVLVTEGRAQMWLRVDRKNNQMGAFDNMGDRPILPGDWRDAKIDADIDPDAATLNVGVMSFGATVFIDDVKLKVSESTVAYQEASPPRKLTARELENVTAAAKLLSYVRFFHPSDAAVGVASWDHFAIHLLESAEPATDTADLAKRLTGAVHPIAPTLEIWPGSPDQAPPEPKTPAGATKIAVWNHFGAGAVAAPSPQQLYRSKVEQFALDKAPPGFEKPYIVKSLGGGVSCRLPVGVYADDDGTLPHAKTPEQWTAKEKLPRLTALNRSTRLAGVALGWGVMQHFYPYFDVAKSDWDAALPAALAKASEDADELAYLFTLRELIAKLNDGHGSVMNPNVKAASTLPFAVQWAGADLVIAGKAPSVPDTVSIGDIIVAIDGRPAEDCYAEVARRISAATAGWKRFQSQRSIPINLATGDAVKLTLRKPGGQDFTVELARSKDFNVEIATNKRPANGSELAPGIVYFDLNGAPADALEAVMPKLVAAKGVVFDMRGYPNQAAYELMQHLIDKPAASARWIVATVRWPDHEHYDWNDLSRWDLRPKEPRLTAKIAFVTDGRAISYAESIMGIVENYKFGEIVGATTAGTNGNVNPFELPGGYHVSWTGMRVLKHDGSQHHGVGIAPTVPVTPTAAGIAAGRDEVLEKAIEVLKSKIAAP